MNGEKDYAYYLFDQRVGDDIIAQYDPEKLSDNKAYWALDRMIPVCYVGETTYDLVRQADDENADIDYEGAIKTYKDQLNKLLPYVKTYSDQEMAAMKTVTDMFK